MPSDNNSLRITLIISLAVHSGIVLLAQFNYMPSKALPKEVEVTYLDTKSAETVKLRKELPRRQVKLPQAGVNTKPLPQELENPTDRSFVRKLLPPLFRKEKVFSKYNEFLKNKPQLSKPDVIAVKKKIALTPLEPNRITNPSYISYYQIVREKIRRCAYQNYSSEDSGDVYLSFLISADGSLVKAMVIEEKSVPNAYLKQVAIKSVKDASAFPPFPKDLDYRELSFNVIISFEIE